jgi:hypothetical protein
MTLKRRTLLKGAMPMSLAALPPVAWAQGLEALSSNPILDPKPMLARFLYMLAPLPAFTVADYQAASTSLLARANQVPALKSHVDALVQRLNAANFMGLSVSEQRAFLRGIQATPEFRFLSNPAFGVFNHNPTWPRIGYEGASYQLGGYRHRGFDDIDWIASAVKGVQ